MKLATNHLATASLMNLGKPLFNIDLHESLRAVSMSYSVSIRRNRKDLRQVRVEIVDTSWHRTLVTRITISG